MPQASSLASISPASHQSVSPQSVSPQSVSHQSFSYQSASHQSVSHQPSFINPHYMTLNHFSSMDLPATVPASQPGNTNTKSSQSKDVKAKERLQTIYNRTTEAIKSGKIDTHRLGKCKPFVWEINQSTGSRFVSEIQKLSLDAFYFCSIAFSQRDLATFRHNFTADQVEDQLRREKIELRDHKVNIQRRLLLYSQENDRFRCIYDAVQQGSVPSLSEYTYTFFLAEKRILRELFTESSIAGFQDVTNWSAGPRAPSMRMDLFRKGAKFVIDIPQSMEAPSDLSDLFQSSGSFESSGFSKMDSVQVTTQMTKQLVIHTSFDHGIRIASRMFPRVSNKPPAG